jgi:signal transduction histidine kinase
MMPHTYKTLLLGNHDHKLFYSAFKLAILTGQLSLLSFVMNAGYVFFDLYHHVYHSWPLLSVSAIMSLVSFGLNRQGYYLAAKVVLGLTTNLTIFFFSSIEPVETGLSFLFVVCALGAISTLGLEHKKLAYVFVSLPVLFFVFSVVFDLEVLIRRPTTADYVQMNMIINFIATFVAAVLMIYFLLSLNNHSEQALRENEKRLHDKNKELEKTNKELDRFVYSASHDLRSPISSVRGLIGLVRLNPHSPDTKSYLEMMDNQLIGLNKFIEDIVLYSRNTRAAYKVELIQLKKLVKEVLISLQFFPGSEKIKIVVNIPDETTLYSDPTRVRIVLANLLSNALKYSDPAKENPFIKINATKVDLHLAISVQDNGVGIDRQYVSKIFDMFYQGNEKSDGSGLGLYIVKETLEKIQGEISVQSELGKGSEFKVILPIQIDAFRNE